MHHSYRVLCIPALRRACFPLRRSFTLLAAIVAACAAVAQTGGTGRIEGRIFNPATQEYVRNAEIAVEGTNLATFSGDNGSYILTNVPVGEVALSVTYTGYDRATARVAVAPGQTVTRDFELQGSVYRPGAKAGSEIVTLEKFVVSNEREGNAKAIMEQRAALNMKNVVASDNFGDVTGGNIGEFMKYLPGVVMDYVDADARSVRISGLDPKYAAVSMDGMRMASAASASFGGNTRQFEFEQASITSIESIELNKTLTASMDADAPAGTMNLRSKNAFDRKGREITAHVSLTANPYEMSLRRTPSPGDGHYRKIRPGFVFSYADSFKQRFGVQLSLSANSLFNEQAGVTHAYDTSNAARGPVLTQIVFRDNPKITSRAAMGLNLDYKIMPGLVVSLRTSASHFEDEINARAITFRASAAQIDPSSTLTYVLANPSNNSNTRLEQNIGHSHKFNDTVTYTPKIEFKRHDLTVTAGGGYSRSRTHYEDRRTGYWGTTNNRITRMSWSARRSSPSSTDWQITRVSGPDWSDLASYNRNDANNNNVGTNERNGQSQVFAGYVDVKRVVNLGLPVTIGAGWKTRLTTYDLSRTGGLRWTYVGPTGNQRAASTVMIPHTESGLFNPRQGGNISALNLPITNATAMYNLFRSNPDHFVESEFNNFRVMNTSARSIKERVNARYLELNTRWRKLRLNIGARQEDTRTVGKIFDVLPNSLVRAAGYTPNTIEYLTYQYRNFEKRKRYGKYDNTFFSGGAKYELTRNLTLQLAASQSIGRPDYNNLAGAIAVNENSQTVRMPNPDLKPEMSDKYFASVQYYIEPAGTFSISGYQLAVENMGVSNTEISAEEAGYANDPEYLGYTFLRPTNLDGIRKIKGVEVEYSQQLVFLPGFWRGFSVFGSISRAAADTRVTNLVPKAANGGIRYSNHKFNVQLRSTWSAARLVSVSSTQTQWLYERIMFDLSGGYKFNDRYELTVSGRNILNSPNRRYMNEPGIVRQNMYYGPVWTVGVRGRF